MKVRLIDGTSISSVWFEGDFDAMLHWWQMGADPEITLFFASDRTPPRGRNINYFADDSLTTLLYASDRTVDQGEARRAAQGRAAARGRAGAGDPAVQHDQDRCGAGRPRRFQGQPDERGPFWNVHRLVRYGNNPTVTQGARDLRSLG